MKTKLVITIITAVLLFPVFSTATDCKGDKKTGNRVKVEVDVASCQAVLDLFKEMKKESANKKELGKKLDVILATKTYKTMFKHYNRSWRPNHLPPAVFKRMVLSLRFPELYKKGENKRADYMLVNWKKFYNDLEGFQKEVDHLQSINIQELVDEAVEFTRSWLPEEMKVPGFFLTVHPNGGSGAFALQGAQGYDFFQLQRAKTGGIHLKHFANIISHECHHLGLNIPDLGLKNPKHELALTVLALMVGEGTATKFIDNLDGGKVPRIDLKREPNTWHESMIASDWKKYTRNIHKIWLKFFLAIEHAYTGEITEEQFNKEIRSYWISGIIGRNYFLGSEIFGAIYHGLGKKACFQAMRDPRKMLPLYNQALDKNKKLLGKCTRIPASIIRICESIGKE